MAAKIVTSVVVTVTHGDITIEGEFRGTSLPPTAGEAMDRAYKAARGTSFVAISSEVLETLRKAAYDCVSVSIQYSATAYALSVLEETPEEPK